MSALLPLRLLHYLYPNRPSEQCTSDFGLRHWSRWVTVISTSRAATGFTFVFSRMHTKSSCLVTDGRVQVFNVAIERRRSVSFSLVCVFPASVACVPVCSAPLSFQKTRLLLHEGYETAPLSSILAPRFCLGLSIKSYRLWANMAGRRRHKGVIKPQFL